MAEEIKSVTFDFWGEQLEPYLAAQRLYKAGFTDAKLLAVIWAVMEGESGGYLKAWHNNVERTPEGDILLSEGMMTVKSTDLGFIQRNVVHTPTVRLEPTREAVGLFIEDLFNANPKLANGQESANIAYTLFKQRGFKPWYAYTNGSYRKNVSRGCLAVGNFLALANGERPIPHMKRIVS